MKKRFLLLIVVLSIVFGCIPMNALAQENLHDLVSKSVVRIVNEVNDGYALGCYGLLYINYAKLLSARWAQLTQTEDECAFDIN